ASFDNTNLISRLWSACLGTIAFSPDSAALNAPSLVSNRRPPFCFSEPWHLKQCFSSTGRTSPQKSGGAPAVGSVSTAAINTTTNKAQQPATFATNCKNRTGWTAFVPPLVL